jgi:hypothetical protein
MLDAQVMEASFESIPLLLSLNQCYLQSLTLKAKCVLFTRRPGQMYYFTSVYHITSREAKQRMYSNG